jgi:hypothetical protein
VAKWLNKIAHQYPTKLWTSVMNIICTVMHISTKLCTSVMNIICTVMHISTKFRPEKRDDQNSNSMNICCYFCGPRPQTLYSSTQLFAILTPAGEFTTPGFPGWLGVAGDICLPLFRQLSVTKLKRQAGTHTDDDWCRVSGTASPPLARRRRTSCSDWAVVGDGCDAVSNRGRLVSW